MSESQQLPDGIQTGRATHAVEKARRNRMCNTEADQHSWPQMTMSPFSGNCSSFLWLSSMVIPCLNDFLINPHDSGSICATGPLPNSVRPICHDPGLQPAESKSFCIAHSLQALESEVQSRRIPRRVLTRAKPEGKTCAKQNPPQKKNALNSNCWALRGKHGQKS